MWRVASHLDRAAQHFLGYYLVGWEWSFPVSRLTILGIRELLSAFCAAALSFLNPPGWGIMFFFYSKSNVFLCTSFRKADSKAHSKCHLWLSMYSHADSLHCISPKLYINLSKTEFCFGTEMVLYHSFHPTTYRKHFPCELPHPFTLCSLAGAGIRAFALGFPLWGQDHLGGLPLVGTLPFEPQLHYCHPSVAFHSPSSHLSFPSCPVSPLSDIILFLYSLTCFRLFLS